MMLRADTTSTGTTSTGATSTRTTSTDTTSTDAVRTATGSSRILLVDGMTCDHCVGAVTDELSALNGVTAVFVDLRPGSPSPVTVQSTGPLDDGEVRAALAEAGYELHPAVS